VDLRWYFAVVDLRTGAIRQWTSHNWDQTITDGEYLYRAETGAHGAGAAGGG
jgi:hypothetical protein